MQQKIGATGFEPATSRPPAERATKLRHTPIISTCGLFSTDFAIIADIFHFEKRFTAGFLFVIIIFRRIDKKWREERDLTRQIIQNQKDISMENHLKKGIVSFDVDMTLLNHQDWRIPDSAMEALRKLREQYYIVVATGRDMDAKFSAGLAQLIRPDAMIHLNGTKITINGRILYEHQMKRDLVRELLLFTEGKSFAMGVTVGSEDYFMNPEYVTRHDMIRWGQSDRSFRDPWKLLEMPVRTMAYIGKEPGTKLVEKAFPGLKLPMFSSREGADVIEREVSKADGLVRLCKHWGLPISQTIAFGDSMNDYEIIKMAGTGVAMGNSPEALKQAADYVTAPIGEDGVWKACIHLGLFHENLTP